MENIWHPWHFWFLKFSSGRCHIRISVSNNWGSTSTFRLWKSSKIWIFSRNQDFFLCIYVYIFLKFSFFSNDNVDSELAKCMCCIFVCIVCIGPTVHMCTYAQSVSLCVNRVNRAGLFCVCSCCCFSVCYEMLGIRQECAQQFPTCALWGAEGTSHFFDFVLISHFFFFYIFDSHELSLLPNTIPKYTK